MEDIERKIRHVVEHARAHAESPTQITTWISEEVCRSSPKSGRLIDDVLELACLTNECSFLLTLLEAGLDPNLIVHQTEKCTMLMSSSLYSIGVVKCLLQHKASVTSVDTDGNTAMHWASSLDLAHGTCSWLESLAIMHELHMRGASTKLRNIHNDTPIDILQRQESISTSHRDFCRDIILSWRDD